MTSNFGSTSIRRMHWATACWCCLCVRDGGPDANRKESSTGHSLNKTAPIYCKQLELPHPKAVCAAFNLVPTLYHKISNHRFCPGDCALWGSPYANPVPCAVPVGRGVTRTVCSSLLTVPAYSNIYNRHIYLHDTLTCLFPARCNTYSIPDIYTVRFPWPC